MGSTPPSGIFKWKSQSVKKLGLAPQQGQLSEDELLQLMIQEPNLIKRPLIIVDGHLVAGFDKASKPRLAEILGTPI